MMIRAVTLLSVLALAAPLRATDEPRSISGIYPHLAMFNDEGECGTGAVVPWADRLWVITYGPHLPFGSSDKLYEITPDLQQVIRPESVGGTPANRMIHRESDQLFMGPYVIDAQRKVRVIPSALMPGRLTANARHLTDPAGKIYYATMEEGLYEVDVNTLDIKGLIRDANGIKAGITKEANLSKLSSKLPGYHGKGLYSGQGRVVYANNGDQDKKVLTEPSTPSGALGEWRADGEDWTLVRRNQFTEVTGPGGIYGNAKPEKDVIWSIGWDHRSLILMALDQGQWHAYRLPKGSHCYDGAHGWNTEWPRIRAIGGEEDDLLMTMHGTFWRFPKTFSAGNSAGIAPRSTYLKVIGDFTRWQDRVVFGCDDTAKSEFLNKRRAKGDIVGPGQSQSNLWFVEEKTLDNLGPALGRGAVWMDEAVKAEQPSDPYLFSGYAHRGVHLKNDGDAAKTFIFEVDAAGNGQWQALRQVEVAAKGYRWVAFSDDEKGAWVRIKLNEDAQRVTALFQYQNADTRPSEATDIFAGLAKPGDSEVTGGLIHARGGNFKTLRFIARDEKSELGSYDLDAALKLQKSADLEGEKWTREHVAIPQKVLVYERASILMVDEKGRWRLPRASTDFDSPGALGDERIDREVCTERDLFNAGGLFYELPAENAGGFAKIRPITTHNRRIKDYASYRGLLVMTGLTKDAAGERVVSSEDGQAKLWVGAVDDLWQLGKARGFGGPWLDSQVKAEVPSDPFLMTGFDRKTLLLSVKADKPVVVRVEVDISGTGLWCAYKEIEVANRKVVSHEFPKGFGAYWVRLIADQDCEALGQLMYE